MTRNGVAAKVANEKSQHPERFCPKAKCLWRTGGTHCPRHAQPESRATLTLEANEIRSRMRADVGLADTAAWIRHPEFARLSEISRKLERMAS